MHAHATFHQRVGIIHEQNSILCDEPEEHDDAEHRNDVERLALLGLHAPHQCQQDQRSDNRQRHREHDDQRLEERPVEDYHQNVDQHERRNQRNAHVREGLFHKLGVTLRFEADALRKKARRLHLLLQRSDHLTQRIAGKHVAVDVDDPLAIEALDLRRRGRPAKAGHVADGNQRTVACANLHELQCVFRRAVGGGKLYAHVDQTGGRTHLGRNRAIHRDASHRRDVRRIDSQELALGAIDVDVHAWRAIFSAGLHVDGARYRP